MQAWKKTESPLCLNIAPPKDPSITSGLSQKAAKDDDSSLLVGASLTLNLEGDNISLVGDDAYLIGGHLYPPRDEYLGVSTATGHTIASKVKHDTSIFTQ